MTSLGSAGLGNAFLVARREQPGDSTPVSLEGLMPLNRCRHTLWISLLTSSGTFSWRMHHWRRPEQQQMECLMQRDQGSSGGMAFSTVGGYLQAVILAWQSSSWSYLGPAAKLFYILHTLSLLQVTLDGIRRRRGSFSVSTGHPCSETLPRTAAVAQSARRRGTRRHAVLLSSRYRHWGYHSTGSRWTSLDHSLVAGVVTDTFLSFAIMQLGTPRPYR